MFKYAVTSISHEPAKKWPGLWWTQVVFRDDIDKDPLLLYTWGSGEGKMPYTQAGWPVHDKVPQVMETIMREKYVRVALSYNLDVHLVCGKVTWVEQLPGVGILALSQGKRSVAIDPSAVIGVATASNTLLWSHDGLPVCCKCGHVDQPTKEGRCVACSAPYDILSLDSIRRQA